ncbi:2TM domain-containing protein [Flavobacterium sp.]|uniref:2TM domain-containing protein n=1 Tax=Flavobacterium sp. TaxID=239 RepID=UPI0012259391|nr:2TM domain-containing protein [Flavobacterium sp.]RZJ71208.1 MAG: 2TM domain-containing protein [Flavobacterium sp.]
MEKFNQDPTDEMRYMRAQKRVKAISGFYKHLTVYVIINTGFLVVNALNVDEGKSFFSFENFSMAIFWGVGLLVHALSTFGAEMFLGSNWEAKKIREIMDKDKRQGKEWE